MATACIPQITFGFEPKGKPIVATFDMPHASSDGGAVLLKSLDTQLELTKRLAGCLRAPPRSWTLLLALAGFLRQAPSLGESEGRSAHLPMPPPEHWIKRALERRLADTYLARPARAFVK